MKCPKCGRIIDDDSKYCDYCGTKVLQANTLKKETQIPDAAPQQTPPQVEAPAPEAPKKSSSSRKRLGILGVIFVMIGIGVGAFFLGQQTKPVPVDYVATDYVVADTTSDDYIVPDTVAEVDAIETEQRQREEAEAYRKAKAEAEKKAKAEAEQKVKEEAEIRAKAEAEQKAKEEARKAEEVARKAEAARIEEAARRAEKARKAEERKAELKSQGWVDLGLPSGTLWKDKNELGGFYTYDEAFAKYGSSLPTKEQLEELKNKCKWTWVGNGYRVNGPSGEYIFLPAAGYRSCSGGVSGVGSYGYYWSSTPTGSEYAWRLDFFRSSGVHVYDGSRCSGRSVRLVR
jgi:chemotaxis protein histidine kinase CheA